MFKNIDVLKEYKQHVNFMDRFLCKTIVFNLLTIAAVLLALTGLIVPKFLLDKFFITKSLMRQILDCKQCGSLVYKSNHNNRFFLDL